MDALVTQWINVGAGSYPLLDGAMIALANYGVPVMVLLVALHWYGRPGRTHLRHVAVVAGLTFLLALAFNQAVLLGVHRPRPYAAGLTHLILPASADWSFPSDHASASFAVVCAFCRQRLPRSATGFFLLASLISLSRVYCGIHYVGDLVGGMATALLAAVLVRALYHEGSRLDRAVTALL